MKETDIGKRARVKRSIPQVNRKMVEAFLNGKQHTFKSIAEYKYATALEQRKRVGLIADWAYEPRFFNFDEIKHGTTRYKPDFWIKNIDQTEEYIEIKGYLVPKDRVKMKRMAKYYPEIKITMLDSKKFLPMDWENWKPKAKKA